MLGWARWGGSESSSCSLEENGIFKICCTTKSFDGHQKVVMEEVGKDAEQRPDPSTAACTEAPSRLDSRPRSERFSGQGPRLDKKGRSRSELKEKGSRVEVGGRHSEMQSRIESLKLERNGHHRRTASASPTQTSSPRNSASPVRNHSQHGHKKSAARDGKHDSENESPKRGDSPSRRNSRPRSPVGRSDAEVTNRSPHSRGRARCCHAHA